MNEALHELPHALAAKRHETPDGHSLANLELSHGNLGLGALGLLARDDREFVDRMVEFLGVFRRLAYTHVDGDFFKTRNLHHVLVTELFLQSRNGLLAIFAKEARSSEGIGSICCRIVSHCCIYS